MARMRAAKAKLKEILQGNDWQEHLGEIAAGGMANVGALFSFLLLDPLMRHKAALALGRTVAKIAAENPEAARNIIRRFIWHMSEESGNIGWGIPEAFAECLAASPELAKTYHKILISYIIDLGFDDNYCDNDQIRRSCYWAIGRLARTRPELASGARQWLLKGLQDKDSICRGMAAWALAQLPPDMMDAPALRQLAESGDNDECEIFDCNNKMDLLAVSELARRALARDTI